MKKRTTCSRTTEAVNCRMAQFHGFEGLLSLNEFLIDHCLFQINKLYFSSCFRFGAKLNKKHSEFPYISCPSPLRYDLPHHQHPHWIVYLL